MSNLAPLDFGFLDKPKPLGQVNSGSPTTEVGGHTGRSLVIPESQCARIPSADSVSICSDDDPQDTNWTGAAHSSWLGRPTSSNYSNNYYGASNTNLPATKSQAYARQSNARKSTVIVPDDIDELPPSGTYDSDMSWLNLHAER
ncbi:Kelch-type beta propeller [Penicillium malachiteum]|nr:Kelch-type beta propeller [Penicillium malachiteum]